MVQNLILDERSEITVQADYSSQGLARETIGGLMYGYKLGEFTDDPKYVLGIGAYMRLDDAFIPVIKLDMLPLSMAISYDVNISTLNTVSQGQGGFELSISYIGFLDRENSAKNKMLCPRLLSLRKHFLYLIKKTFFIFIRLGLKIWETRPVFPASLFLPRKPVVVSTHLHGSADRLFHKNSRKEILFLSDGKSFRFVFLRES